MASNEKRPPAPDMANVVGLATQMANTMLVCLREVHHYLLPKAQADGIMLDAQAAQSWAMSLWIAAAHEKAWLYMPATRFKAKAETNPSNTSGGASKTVPFSEPNISPALWKLRQMLERDAIDEAELLAILREAAPRGTPRPATLEDAPERSLELLIKRFDTVRELVEAGRADA
jgi:hypothetical protein